MNFLQIGSYLFPDTPGGAEISAQNVALALGERGHRIVRLRWRASEQMRFKGLVEQVEPGQWSGSTWRPYSPLETKGGVAKAIFYAMEFMAPLSRAELADLCARENIDGVIIHSLRGLGYDLLRKLADINLPTIIFLHDFALICLNKGMFRKGSACKRACLECRFLAKSNASALTSIDSLSIVGASKQLVDKTRDNLALENARYFNIPNPNAYNLRPRVRSAPQHFVLGYVGRMEHDKGIIGLLDVADRLRDKFNINFILAGAGSLADVVIEYAASRPWVDYRGFVQPTKVVEVYDAMDILAVPSLWAENFPGVLVQALGNGVPAIGFDIGGTPEIIQDGRTGIVVPVGDFRAMYDGIASIIKNPIVFNDMSENSIEASKMLAPDVLRAAVVEAIEGTVVKARALFDHSGSEPHHMK